MSRKSVNRTLALGLLLSVAIAAASDASTFFRAGLETLTEGNDLVVHGVAKDIHSYWSHDGAVILTDITVSSLDVVKGEPADELTITLIGGVVGDISTLVVGGPAIEPGGEYVLFLTHGDLFDFGRALSVPDQAQGVFDVERDGDRFRAVSQATGHDLMEDADGKTLPPGGADGMDLDELVSIVRGYTF